MGVRLSWASLDDWPVPEGSVLYVSFGAWGQIQDEMAAQGMVYNADHLRRWLPTWADFDVPDDADGTPELRAWEEACEPILRAEDVDPQGLPEYKLDSGHGHVLTPREIEAGLAKAADPPVTLTDPDLVRLWSEVLAFLKTAAAEGDGARVNVGAVAVNW